MKNLVLLFLLAVLVSAAPVTQDKADDLKKLFALIQVDKMINSTLDNMLPMLKQQAKNQFLGENDNEKFDAFVEVVSEEAKLMSKKLKIPSSKLKKAPIKLTKLAKEILRKLTSPDKIQTLKLKITL